MKKEVDSGRAKHTLGSLDFALNVKGTCKRSECRWRSPRRLSESVVKAVLVYGEGRMVVARSEGELPFRRGVVF